MARCRACDHTADAIPARSRSAWRDRGTHLRRQRAADLDNHAVGRTRPHDKRSGRIDVLRWRLWSRDALAQRGTRHARQRRFATCDGARWSLRSCLIGWRARRRQRSRPRPRPRPGRTPVGAVRRAVQSELRDGRPGATCLGEADRATFAAHIEQATAVVAARPSPTRAWRVR